MMSFVKEGDKVLVMLADEVCLDDIVDFVAAIKQHIGDFGKLLTTTLSNLKKGKLLFYSIFNDYCCMKQ